MKITDVIGKTVMTRNINANETIFETDVNTLSKGLYIVQLISEEGTLEKKIIKQ
jgi:hypothetical protein